MAITATPREQEILLVTQRQVDDCGQTWIHQVAASTNKHCCGRLSSWNRPGENSPEAAAGASAKRGWRNQKINIWRSFEEQDLLMITADTKEGLVCVTGPAGITHSAYPSPPQGPATAVNWNHLNSDALKTVPPHSAENYHRSVNGHMHIINANDTI